MEQAIKIAIENGWNSYRGFTFTEVQTLAGNDLLCDLVHVYESSRHSHTISLPEICIDPLFWQALGKGLGWKNQIVGSFPNMRREGSWQNEWHRFIDMISDGDTIDTAISKIIN